MTGRQAVPTVAAVIAVAVAAVAHMLMAPAPSPMLVNVAVLGAVAACAYTATANLQHNRQVDRDDAAAKKAAADRADALRQAADCVITGRPDGPEGRPHPADSPSVTPAAVARYAATMGITAVTLEEAERALRERLMHRGYAPPAPIEHPDGR